VGELQACQPGFAGRAAAKYVDLAALQSLQGILATAERLHAHGRRKQQAHIVGRDAAKPACIKNTQGRIVRQRNTQRELATLVQRFALLIAQPTAGGRSNTRFKMKTLNSARPGAMTASDRIRRTREHRIKRIVLVCLFISPFNSLITLALHARQPKAVFGSAK
jgi:hypothetical protein